MRIKSEDLNGRLQALRPVYLVCGDEPFLLEEAVACIKAAAEQAGFGECQRFSLESGFSWQRFRETISSPSLFAPRSLYELRAREGRESLGREIATCLPLLTADTILLVVTGPLERASQKAEWVEACAQIGHVVTATSLVGERLVDWVRGRLKAAAIVNEDIARRIAYYAEGNMGAASDAIARLKDEPQQDMEALANIMGDEARFDVFAVTDAALRGDMALTYRYVRRLRAEARDPILVSWALAREVRTLVKIAAAQARKEMLADLFRRERAWPARQALLLSAAKRLSQPYLRRMLFGCVRLDRVNKGRAEGDSWLLIEGVAMALAGMPSKVLG